MGKYKGSIELISGLKQANNQDFPLMDASAIQVDDEGTRLDEALKMLVKINERANRGRLVRLVSGTIRLMIMGIRTMKQLQH